MTAGRKGRIGRILVVALAAVSAGYPLLSRLPIFPDCPLGYDRIGNTVCYATFAGLWRSEVIGLASGAISAALALGLALLARRYSGWVDEAITKTADLVFAVPDVLILILIAFAVALVEDARNLHPPPSIAIVVMTASLAAVGWAAPTRMIRNRLRSLEGQDFIAAAEAIGATRGRIVVRHLLPFASDYVFSIFLLRVPAAILAESTVSFLGFGMPPSQPSLGTFLGQNYQQIVYGDVQVVIPAWILLILVVIAFQWTGQGVLARGEARA